jgi:hypothetical protein
MARKSRGDHGRRDRAPRQGDKKAKQIEGGQRLAKWEVIAMEVAKKEGRKILSGVQYDHIIAVLKRLVLYPAA